MENDISTQIIGIAIKVHTTLGPGLLESIYEEAICFELMKRNIPFSRQVEVPVYYEGVILKTLRLDLLVDNAIIIEVKSSPYRPQFAVPQLLSYLNSTAIQTGLILNFGLPRMMDGVKRVSRIKK
ncbi:MULTISPECIES: GxxExxY protein [unclassified Fusibacter]|uniref:GxxExxY protein n=1 Tax=unclassified Fusibacter TaxID=2624464 RepID=UPI0010112FF2|nr:MULTISPECIES: GxxExxY protein [unclassified Fusibacter]MCK8061270.1 GxxExxY protein [Fusibacter sp. A2]NPE23900.1 GxxExxY protein [Fusibacter sp. A1]RXV58096.1 GxxExxY protein [Fusibacter sp. A1]